MISSLNTSCGWNRTLVRAKFCNEGAGFLFLPSTVEVSVYTITKAIKELEGHQRIICGPRRKTESFQVYKGLSKFQGNAKTYKISNLIFF